MRVAVFLDGSPGHEKQTQGIIKALDLLCPLDKKEIKVKRQTLIQDIWSWIRYFLVLDSFSSQYIDTYDLLIGTGSHTHIPMLAYKRHCDALTCTCMAPPWILRRKFDLCFIPQHDGITERTNVVTTVGPPNCSEAKGNHDHSKGLILLGGTDIKSHHWNSTDVADYVLELIKNETEKEWTISSSPRTPQETVSLIEKIALQFYNVRFFKYEDTESGWVEKQYDRNKTVWVTADSMSMVYEALSAGCSVGILPVIWKNKDNKFKRSEDFLLEQGLVISFAAWKDGSRRWKEHLPLNEAGRCADEIVKIWYQKN
jgi:uncharacterized protein